MNKTVEIEGKEMLEFPNGATMQAQGPSHEGGGITLPLPVGTQVYSKRLKVDGKTMAKRKEDRDRRVKRAYKLVSDNPFDVAKENTLRRTAEQAQMEDMSDMMLQEQKQTDKMKCGGKVKMGMGGKVKYAYGSGPAGIPQAFDPLFQSINDNVHGPFQQPYFANAQPTPVVNTFQKYLDKTGEKNMNYAMNAVPFAPQEQAQRPGFGQTVGNIARALSPAMGPAGAAIGMLGPLATTIVNRLGDKQNESFYEDFGRQGLATNARSMRNLSSARTQGLQDLRLAQAGADAQSFGSVNTARSSRQLNAANTQRSQTQLNRNYIDALDQSMQNRSQLQNQRDQMVMQGRERADLANVQDRDQFYTNLSGNLSNLGTGLMTTARNRKAPIDYRSLFGI